MRTEKPPRSWFRGDVEGLRGVAVLLVVLDHLGAPGFGGGFFGVDVFFVISGYLITSLLASEYAKKAEERGGRGSISIVDFYARRARRILPAALTVIVAVVVAGEALLNELGVAQIRHDGLWAVFFASNVNFIRQATDYFAQGLVDSSPFQHYWSLAVEEQFYFVWPALFLLAARFTCFGAAARWRARVATAVCAIGAASLAWSVVATGTGSQAAYFSTFTRGWELALGALIGITTTGATRFPGVPARTASAAGVALFAASFAVIGATTPFPGAVALLPTAATALFVVGGLTDRAPLPNRALCFAPLRFVGRISYSVYLWHWPLIVFAAALYPRASETAQMRVLILLVTLAVATLSYHLVERPGRRVGGPVSRNREPTRVRNLAALALGACILVTAFVGLLSVVDRERSRVVPTAMVATVKPQDESSPTVVTRARTQSRGNSYTKTIHAWQRVIRAGLRMRRLPPALEPLAPHLSRAFPPPCVRGLRGVSAEECVVGNPAAANVAVLNGDSHAEMLRNSVWRAFDPRTWSIHIFARDGCGWAGGAEVPTTSPTTCARQQASALRRIRELHPDVLLLSEHLVVTPSRSRADIALSLATFRGAAGKTIVLGHTPLPRPWRNCLAGVDTTGCFTSLDATFLRDRAIEQQLATRARVRFVDTSTWLCVRAGAQSVCPPVIAGVPAFKDDTHISAEYQLKLVPIVRALLQSTGMRPGPLALHKATYRGALQAWQRQVRSGLAVRTLPRSLQPLHPHLVRYIEPSCNRKLARVEGECVVGNGRARHVAVLTGDSHAGMFQLALLRALGRKTWRLHIFQRGHCGWAGSVAPDLPVTADECRVYQQQAESRIRALRPDLLVLSEADLTTPYRSESEISASLASLSKLARRTVVLGHTPTVPAFEQCLSGAADISACAGAQTRSYRSDVVRERALATRAGAEYVDTSAWFCVTADGRSACPPLIDGAPVWRDGTHITSDLEPKLIPLIRAILAPLLAH